MTSKKSPWRKRLAWLVFVSTTTLGLLEITLRLTSLPMGESPIFIETAERGLRTRPHLDFDGLRTNSWGFNDEDWQSEKPEGVERLAIIGDSFVVGAVPREQNFVSRLQHRLRGRPQAIEVLNLGIAAAGPEIYTSVLQHEALELDVDQVIMMFFVGNDVQQSHPDFKTRVFFGAPRELLQRPYLLRPSIDYLYSLRLLRAARRTALERWFSRDKTSPGTFSRSAFLAIERQRLEICQRNPSSDLTASYDRAVDLLHAMHEQAQKHGMRFGVVLAPDQFQIDPDLQRDLFRLDDLEPADFDLDQPQRLLMPELTQLDIPTLDLLPTFRATRAADGPLYLSQDSHWNERGNELAAEMIEAFLRP